MELVNKETETKQKEIGRYRNRTLKEGDTGRQETITKLTKQKELRRIGDT